MCYKPIHKTARTRGPEVFSPISDMHSPASQGQEQNPESRKPRSAKETTQLRATALGVRLERTQEWGIKEHWKLKEVFVACHTLTSEAEVLCENSLNALGKFRIQIKRPNPISSSRRGLLSWLFLRLSAQLCTGSLLRYHSAIFHH